ncbi:MAG: diguanylate cyclase [Granulosicoccus sp.]
MATSPEIIVVAVPDDDERRLIVKALKLRALDVVEVCDAHELMAYVESDNNELPNAIVLDTDIQFPSDFEFCRWLRKKPRANWLPVLMLSNNAIKDDVDACYAAGATDYIDRPINYQSLGYRIRTFLRTTDAFIRLETTLDELDEHRSRLQQHAYLDILTGLPNRSAFMYHLEAAIVDCEAKGESLVLLFSDVDDFKQINDRFGHVAGDAVLVQLSDRLRSAVTNMKALAPLTDTEDFQLANGSGSLIARLAGDEFIMVLRESSDAFSKEFALQRVLESMQKPFEVAGRVLPVSMSVGVSVYPQDGHTVSTLLHEADLKMYEVKHLGKTA